METENNPPEDPQHKSRVINMFVDYSNLYIHANSLRLNIEADRMAKMAIAEKVGFYKTFTSISNLLPRVDEEDFTKESLKVVCEEITVLSKEIETFVTESTKPTQYWTVK